ncbi:hypothetical protein BWD42_06085 [Sphingobacterium sp. CZ-UAM]|uniref:hypothetical protein n=1 Tax=Sphingobacterium sp. CZ-UAM TaxID=1933868 RepID=UPI000986F998|nr:hypothetical protein [Sphingobacterium sp. CZ-UAM]OOG19492.1 hypothetical protein BWD42_06085 [Sphingobacterium sp. CZ-UAM]
MGNDDENLFLDRSQRNEGGRQDLNLIWGGSQEEFYKSIIRSQQEDLGRIGRYFRDELAQEVYGMRISLQNFTNKHGDFEELRCLRDSLTSLVIELRNKATLLYNPILNDLGIFHAIDEVVASYKQKLGFTIDIILDPNLKELQRHVQVRLFKLLTALFEYLKEEMPVEASSISVQLIDFAVFIKVLPYFKENNTLQTPMRADSPLRLKKITELYSAQIISDSPEKSMILKLTF